MTACKLRPKALKVEFRSEVGEVIAAHAQAKGQSLLLNTNVFVKGGSRHVLKNESNAEQEEPG